MTGSLRKLNILFPFPELLPSHPSILSSFSLLFIANPRYLQKTYLLACSSSETTKNRNLGIVHSSSFTQRRFDSIRWNLLDLNAYGVPDKVMHEYVCDRLEAAKESRWQIWILSFSIGYATWKQIFQTHSVQKLPFECTMNKNHFIHSNFIPSSNNKIALANDSFKATTSALHNIRGVGRRKRRCSRKNLNSIMSYLILSKSWLLGGRNISFIQRGEQSSQL